MLTNIQSPLQQTPSKSLNIERLMSLKKSVKKLSDADILSFAAEASAMKRSVKKTIHSDENTEPNTYGNNKPAVAKRLFDINMTSDTVLEANEDDRFTLNQNIHNISQCSSDNGSESESDTENRHFGQILDIINTNDKNRRMKMSAKVKLAEATLSAEVPTTTTTTETTTGIIDNEVDFGYDHIDTVQQDESGVYTAERAVELPLNTTTTAVVAPQIGAAAIKGMVVSHILHVLNTGTLEEVLSLQNIGQVRALRVVTLRSAGTIFQTLSDLSYIGMNEKIIGRFLKANAAQIVAKVQDGEI